MLRIRRRRWWFQSTPSGGKATKRQICTDKRHALVSIHAFRGEGDLDKQELGEAERVSIHAFRGEGDYFYTVL